MEALNRKPDMSVRKTMNLPDGTRIDVVGIPARKMMAIANDKKMSDMERGIHITAAKILVNGATVVYDDLLDGFTDEEVEQIVQFANDVNEKNGE
ncbi:hypothetical protein [uncultured Rikenella sp.]|uniref:hypothetical protein n=1 Tax=uncultured Rikenella sp. TaxID=368003 RepID=UPI0025FEBB79|nr:hypothetical protein [uncultured Rikenella sp.]